MENMEKKMAVITNVNSAYLGRHGEIVCAGQEGYYVKFITGGDEETAFFNAGDLKFLTMDVAADRQDFVDNAIFDLIKLLNPTKNEVKWDISVISEIRIAVETHFTDNLKFCDSEEFYPSACYGEDCYERQEDNEGA